MTRATALQRLSYVNAHPAAVDRRQPLLKQGSMLAQPCAECQTRPGGGLPCKLLAHPAPGLFCRHGQRRALLLLRLRLWGMDWLRRALSPALTLQQRSLHAVSCLPTVCMLDMDMVSFATNSCALQEGSKMQYSGLASSWAWQLPCSKGRAKQRLSLQPPVIPSGQQ